MKNFLTALPVELWRETQLYLDSQTLASFSSSSRRCRDLALPLLFRSLVLGGQDFMGVIVNSFTQFLTLHPGIANCVRVLTLHGGMPASQSPPSSDDDDTTQPSTSSNRLDITSLSCVLRLMRAIRELSLIGISLDDGDADQHAALTRDNAEPWHTVNLKMLTLHGCVFSDSRSPPTTLASLCSLFGVVDHLYLHNLVDMQCHCVVEDGVAHSREWWHDRDFALRLFELQDRDVKMSVKNLSIYICDNIPLQLVLGLLERSSPDVSSIDVFTWERDQMEAQVDITRLCVARPGMLRSCRLRSFYRE